MPTPAYPRGSEWRKWDLQVHTPFSALNNGFGNDFSAYAKALIERACEDDIGKRPTRRLIDEHSYDCSERAEARSMRDLISMLRLRVGR